MQERMIRVSKEDLGLLELAAGQILKAKRHRAFDEGDTDYDNAAATLKNMKTYLLQHPINFGKYYLLFGGDGVFKKPFYVSSKTGREFYLAPKRLFSRLMKFKEYVPIFLPSNAVSLE